MKIPKNNQRDTHTQASTLLHQVPCPAPFLISFHQKYIPNTTNIFRSAPGPDPFCIFDLGLGCRLWNACVIVGEPHTFASLQHQYEK